MSHRVSERSLARLAGIGRLAAAMAALLLLLPLQPVVLSADEPAAEYGEYVVDVVELDNGDVIVGVVFPSPPPDPADLPAAPIVERTSATAVLLDDVPAFNWCYGCSATSAAMLFGYYDRNGFANMYDGPANGGVCPTTNSVWGYGESPLSATHEGLDGLGERGHVDDYYVTPDSTADPYYGNWGEHGYADCTADFMGTSQYNNWSNVDGATTFYYYTSNGPLYDYSGSESSGRRDGTHGMRLFSESRGYTVLSNYNQNIYGYGGVSAGFTYDQYKAEIDAGRPVLIQVTGHTMLGVGYDDSSSTIYIHDTWDHSLHSMTWGGSYAGRTHRSVSVFQLEQFLSTPEARTDAALSVEETTATLHGTVLDDGGEECEYRFRYGTSSGSYTVSTSWSGAVETGDGFSAPVTGLSKGTTCYYVGELRNSEGTSTGSEQQFTTKPDAPSGFSATAAGADTVNLSWTAGAGAGSTRVQRSAGSCPSGPDDGTTVYDGSGTSSTDTSLDPDTTYCYRAWSETAAGGQWSDSYAEDTATTDGVLPVVSTQAASSVTATGAVLHGTLDNDRGEACEYRFAYDTDSGAPYAFSTTWTGALVTGDPFEENLTGFVPGTAYYFRAQARNSAGDASGGEVSFTTLPDAPSGLSATPSGEDEVSLSWTVGEGATATCIVRKTGGYPADRSDGTQVYFDGGTLFADTGLTAGTAYWYRAWAYDDAAGQWSEGYAEASATTMSDGVPSVMVSPDSFEVLLPPGVSRDYDLTISNTGDGTLMFTVADTLSPSAPAPSGAGDEGELVETRGAASMSQPVDASSVEQIIVKLKDGVRGSAASLHRSLGAAPAAGNHSGRFEVVDVPDDGDAAGLIRDYVASGMVEYAEPNYPRLATWAPDDALYPLQWHLDAVDAEGAWDVQRGGASDVIVAVLDTGVAYETYDVFTQAPDLAGTQSVPGWDFINGDAHPNDDDGHGTHVCGTIAQTTDNGAGVAGLAFGVSVMPVKVLDASGSGTVAGVADGIYYAVDHGAHVINLSLSGSGTSQTEADAIAYAYAHGVTVVCAAGNAYTSGNLPQYPAAYDSTIAVGAVRYDETRAWYSNTGSYLDIIAPGGDTSVDQNGDGYPDGVLQQTFSGSYSTFVYAYYQGTSMACPHVSAVAALLLSENRSLTPDTVRAALESTAVDLGAAGWDESYGHGLLDASAALSAVAGVPWLDESPMEGSVAPSGSTVVTVTVDTSGLADGDYTAAVVVSSNDPSRPAVETPFTLHVRAVTVPVVVTGAATDVEEQTATLHGSVQDYGWEECEYSFQYGNEEGGPYEETSWSGSLGSGESFSEALSSLDGGGEWFFRARARNSAGVGYGDELSFTTKPEAPSALVATAGGTDSIDLSWVAGTGADATRIQRGEDSYPADRDVGVTVYDGSGESASDSGLKPGTTYRYRAWSSAAGGSLWSDGFSEAMAETEPVTVQVGNLGLALNGTGSTAVTIAGAVDLAAATVVLSFDASVAELTAVASGDLGSVSSNGIPDANATGQLTMSWFDVAGHSGDYAFATLTFHAIAAAPSETLLDLSVSTFIDSLGQPIACEDGDGTLSVLNLMEGDVTLDLRTNIVDAMFIAQYTVGLRQFDAVQLLCGDTNDDGHVDIVDAMHVAQYTVDHDGSGGVLFQPLWREAYDAGLLPPA